MKKLIKATIIGASFIFNSFRLHAQEAVISEQVIISEPPLSSPLIYDTLKKDSESIKQIKVEIPNKEEASKREKIDYTKAAFNFISLYDDRVGLSSSEILESKSKSLLEVFEDTLEKNLNENMSYYAFREYRQGDLPYSGVFLATLGDTARKKYELVRKVDHTIKVMQDYVTVKATVGKETKIKIRPTFDDVEENRIGTRTDIDNFLGFNRITVKANDQKVRAGTPLCIFGKKYPLYFDLTSPVNHK